MPMDQFAGSVVTEQDVLETIQKFINTKQEAARQAKTFGPINPKSSIVRDYGLDSLNQVELEHYLDTEYDISIDLIAFDDMPQSSIDGGFLDRIGMKDWTIEEISKMVLEKVNKSF